MEESSKGDKRTSKVALDPRLPPPNLGGPVQVGPQGVTLQMQVSVGVPFKAMIGGYRPTQNNPQGDPRYPLVENDVLLRMYDELVAEIKKRGMKI